MNITKKLKNMFVYPDIIVLYRYKLIYKETIFSKLDPFSLRNSDTCISFSFHRTMNKLWLKYCRYDVTKDKFIDFNELKLMMEKIGAPQTHLSLKAMIKEVDEDHDDKINFREVSYQPWPLFTLPQYLGRENEYIWQKFSLYYASC